MTRTGIPATIDAPAVAEAHRAIPSSSDDLRLLQIYVHIPFCRSKCHFCDWVQPIPKEDLLLRSGDEPRQRYIDALCREIRTRGAELSAAGYIPYVHYWGGGTASILEPHEIDAVMSAMHDSFDMSTVVESTIECSPDSADIAKLTHFRRAGFNRFSSGVQSMNDGRLRQIGRLHDSAGARAVVRAAREAGFEDLNIDLMCGFPGESLDEVAATLTAGLALPITHLSVYPFRPTAGTVLRRQIDRDTRHLYLAKQKAAFKRACTMAKDAGLEEYAAGYFGHAPAYNVLMNFQLRLDTVGFGSGAVSLLDRRFRSHDKGKLAGYVQDPTHYDIDVPATAAPVVMSYLRSGLSVFDGILRPEWEFATGQPLHETLADPAVAPLVDFLRDRGGLQEDAKGVRLPPDRAGRVLMDLSFHTAMAS